MKKLLSLLSMLTISGTAIPTTIAASPYQKEEKLNNNDINYLQTNNLKQLNRIKKSADNLNNQPTVINLNQLKVNNLNIDLNHLNNTSNKNEIKEAILIEIASSNNNNSIINDIVISLLTEENKWRISGITFKVPNLGESLEYNARFFSLDRSKYTGVLSAKIKLSNLKNVKDLQTIINKNELIIDDSEDYDYKKNNNILIILKEKNPTLDINEINIFDLKYKSVVIRPKENSSKYFGSVTIKFIPKIKLTCSIWESDHISLSSYSGPETKTSSKTFRYTVLNKNKEDFIKAFSKIKVKFSGTAITSRPQWVTRDFASQYKSFDIQSDSKQYYFWYEEQQWTGNYDASVAWLKTNWENNHTFVLETAAWIKVDSSAWVTDRSHAESKLKIEEIIFE